MLTAGVLGTAQLAAAGHQCAECTERSQRQSARQLITGLRRGGSRMRGRSAFGFIGVGDGREAVGRGRGLLGGSALACLLGFAGGLLLGLLLRDGLVVDGLVGGVLGVGSVGLSLGVAVDGDLVLVNARSIAEALRSQGIAVTFAYPDDSDNADHNAG